MNQDVRDILNAATYGTLCTAGPDGEPRGTIVRFAMDDTYLYWRSQESAVHSRNIADNPAVFITLYDTTQSVMGGVYIKTQAVKLSGSDESDALRLYAATFDDADKLGSEAAIYRCAIGDPDAAKTLDKMLYYIARSEA